MAAGRRAGVWPNPDAQDIAHYRDAVSWIRDRIDADGANLGNDTRFWADVPALRPEPVPERGLTRRGPWPEAATCLVLPPGRGATSGAIRGLVRGGR